MNLFLFLIGRGLALRAGKDIAIQAEGLTNEPIFGNLFDYKSALNRIYERLPRELRSYEGTSNPDAKKLLRHYGDKYTGFAWQKLNEPLYNFYTIKNHPERYMHRTRELCRQDNQTWFNNQREFDNYKLGELKIPAVSPWSAEYLKPVWSRSYLEFNPSSKMASGRSNEGGGTTLVKKCPSHHGAFYDFLGTHENLRYVIDDEVSNGPHCTPKGVKLISGITANAKRQINILTKGFHAQFIKPKLVHATAPEEHLRYLMSLERSYSLADYQDVISCYFMTGLGLNSTISIEQENSPGRTVRNFETDSLGIGRLRTASTVRNQKRVAAWLLTTKGFTTQPDNVVKIQIEDETRAKIVLRDMRRSLDCSDSDWEIKAIYQSMKLEHSTSFKIPEFLAYQILTDIHIANSVAYNAIEPMAYISVRPRKSWGRVEGSVYMDVENKRVTIIIVDEEHSNGGPENYIYSEIATQSMKDFDEHPDRRFVDKVTGVSKSRSYDDELTPLLDGVHWTGDWSSPDIIPDFMHTEDYSIDTKTNKIYATKAIVSARLNNIYTRSDGDFLLIMETPPDEETRNRISKHQESRRIFEAEAKYCLKEKQASLERRIRSSRFGKTSGKFIIQSTERINDYTCRIEIIEDPDAEDDKPKYIYKRFRPEVAIKSVQLGYKEKPKMESRIKTGDSIFRQRSNFIRTGSVKFEPEGPVNYFGVTRGLQDVPEQPNVDEIEVSEGEEE
eukprot:GHVP01034478.1.p1 GENE.GHVP01034478.1~~GHVP01034478.1.p1  ORF type:complete len:728 (-),score=112.65 GHVP01034478.1:52-2235(-)